MSTIDILEIARATGLRSYLQGVNAQDARALLQTFMDAVSATPTRETSITMTGKQLREALEFVNPDGADDVDQAESEVTITKREAFTSSEGEAMPAGLNVHLAEYPEEGALGPLSVDAPHTV